MPSHNLEDTVGVLQGFILFGYPFVIELVLPGRFVVFSIVYIVAREESVKFRRPLVTGVDEVRGVGIFPDVGHVVIVGVSMNVVHYVFNHAIDESDIGP